MATLIIKGLRARRFVQGARLLFPGASLSACGAHKGYPRTFDMKRLVQNAFSDRPKNTPFMEGAPQRFPEIYV